METLSQSIQKSLDSGVSPKSVDEFIAELIKDIGDRPPGWWRLTVNQHVSGSIPESPAKWKIIVDNVGQMAYNI